MNFKTEDLFKGAEKTVLLAGAGAGKTTWLLNVIDRELKKTDPSRICFVTFTRKGIEEAKDRLYARHPELNEDDLEYFRTFHSLCFHELHLDPRKLWSPKYEAILNKAVGSDVHRRYSADHATMDNRRLDAFDVVRAGGRADPDITCTPQYKRLTAAYTEVKKQTGAIDFTDCLEKFVEAGKSLPVDILILDESQDTTDLQWLVADLAAKKARQVYIAGDDYQSVFTYAGANPKRIVELADCSKTVKLEVSHRLPKKAYRLAKTITDMLTVKVDKDYRPEEGCRDGEVTYLSDTMALYPFLKAHRDESWYILTRNTSFQEGVADTLKTMVLPYKANGVFVIPSKDMAVLRKYRNAGKEGVPVTTVERISEELKVTDFTKPLVETVLFDEYKRALYQSYIDKYGVEKLSEMEKGSCPITVSNIHRVKGGEADNVAVLLDCGKKTEESILEDEDSELRTLYVAVTRVKNRLFLVHSERNPALDNLLTRCLSATRIKKGEAQHDDCSRD